MGGLRGFPPGDWSLPESHHSCFEELSGSEAPKGSRGVTAGVNTQGLPPEAETLGSTKVLDSDGRCLGQSSSQGSFLDSLLFKNQRLMENEFFLESSHDFQVAPTPPAVERASAP